MKTRNSLFATLVVFLTLLSGCGLGQKSPSQVVKAFYEAANAARYSEVEQYIASDTLSLVKGTLGAFAGGLKGWCDLETKNGTLTKVDIIREEARGEGATVFARIHFKDGTTKENDKTQLIKEKGEWKITTGGN